MLHAGAPLGVVTSIAGSVRCFVAVTGLAGHAGTVPMDRRHDALVAASLFIETAEGYAQWHEGLVATVGQLTV